ncbi:MAG: polysaccharide biosynthesis/export family protein [Gemmatimonadetes bacterium]|nr:polysaccharide biosynthesis/export family protein [Gemmatimonadota bacterium]
MIHIRSTLAHIAFGVAVSVSTVGASALAAQDFSLRAGDAIKLLVPREKDLTGTFPVDPTAFVTLPLIGRVQVGGKPWNEVNAAILAAYQRQIREPGITLIPLRRVVVLGAVNKPGSYFVEPAGTLSSAVALASGATLEGALRRIRIVRGDSTFRADASRHKELADVPIQSGDQIYVLQRNWFERNSNFLITAILSLTGIVATFVLR